MSLQSLHAMLAEALAGAGLPPASISASGTSLINIKGLEIGMEYLEAEDKVALYCSIGRLSPGAASEIYEFLLEKNLLGAKTGGGHIGLYAPARTLIFSLVLDVTALSAARLSNVLDRFTEHATELIDEMEERLAEPSGNTELSPLMGNMLWA
ncbi:type III secretion system chaperone [Mailhella massiliensis]|uniref:type III secretion system chaperone n=1 Tax=Mailhella massiliensis TaxID=1903261 RepID=UPI00097DD0E2|nr:type III secretion system chaperone [Mailhella massiliensis]